MALPNRYACGILQEMRDLCDKQVYEMMPGLIEELQICFNRMEAAINDYGDYNWEPKVNAEIAALQVKIAKLKHKKKNLRSEIASYEKVIEACKEFAEDDEPENAEERIQRIDDELKILGE